MDANKLIQISGQINNIEINVESVVESWLVRTVNQSLARSKDICNDKSKAVFDFFDFCRKPAELVTPNDVIEWRWHLKTSKVMDGTIYNRISAVAGFYEYLMNQGELSRIILINPAKAALPKSPKSYESESVKALTVEELDTLLQVLEKHAQDQSPIHLRDYAILQIFATTGKRRSEIINLRADNIELSNNRFFIRTKVKGGFFLNFELEDEIAQAALFNYLQATNRVNILGEEDSPLWLRHDRGAYLSKNSGLTTHGFAKRMKLYALEAGIKNFHIHRLRHTFAKIVSEAAESMADTQEALGHSNIKTTQVYVKRLSVKKDKHSKSVRAALKKNSQPS